MAAKPKKKVSFASKMRNRVLPTIKSATFKQGFSEIDLWVSTSNYAMNRLWSGSFDKALLFGRNYVFYGESGSGKSLFCAVAAGDAQRQHGAFVFWLDTEHASDDKAGRKWLERAGIDTSEDCFEYLSLATMSDVKSTIAKTCVAYQEAMNDEDQKDDLPPIVFVVDSWAATMTESQWEKTGGKKAGDVTGDMGQHAKQTGDLIKSVTHLCAGKPIMVIGVQHIMDNQDGYGRKHKTTGGHKMIFYASGCMLLTKNELRLEDVDNVEVTEEYETLHKGMSAEAKKKAGAEKRKVGINAKMEILKSRVSKPFDTVDIQIPYGSGIDAYSGLFNLLQQEGVVTNPSQGWYQYTNADREPVKFQRAKFRDHADIIMACASQDISDEQADDVAFGDVSPEDAAIAIEEVKAEGML